MLSAPLRGLVASLGLALLASPAAAQFQVVGGSALPELPALGDVLDVGVYSVQSLDLPAAEGSSVELSVVLDGTTRTLALQPWSNRSPEHYQVLVQLADGSYVPAEPTASTLWRGVVLDVPGSRVSADLSGGQLDALVRLTDDGPVWAVQPLRDVLPDAAISLHAVYNSVDSIDRGLSCGGALLAHGGAPETSDDQGYAGIANDKVCQIACDADLEFYNKNSSSVANTEADIINIIDRVENIYQADVSIQYEITTIIVRTAEPDPYSSTNAGTLLNQFQSHWNSSQGAVVRDVAHLFTGKSIQGGTIGIAFLNVICNLGSAYGLSESKFSSNLVSRTGLTAHELGHNWSASHCDGASDCWIMCSGIGGCAGSLTKFGSGSKNAINNKKNSVGCLSNAVPPLPPVLNSLSPSTISPLGGTINIQGTGMDTVVSVLVDGQSMPFTTVGNSQVNVTVSAVSSLGSLSVQALGEGGPSNSLSVGVVAAQPPLTSAPISIATFVQTSATWTVATEPADIVYFLVDLDPGTFNYKGYSLLATPLPVLQVPLNAAGVGQLVVPIDPSMGGVGFYTVYSQFAFFRPTIYAAGAVHFTTVL